MALDKNDFEQIEKIVERSENRLRKEIQTTVEKSENRLHKEISGVETSMRKEIKDTENRVISVLTREITDLSEINRDVIHRVDGMADLEKRVMRIEHKLGIT